ncbi:hypothetical protein QAD02_006935, partial [Eretmocerus hayati]
LENLWNRELRLRGPSSASLLVVSWQFVRFRFLISCVLSTCAQIITFVLYASLFRELLEYRGKPTKMDLASSVHWVFLITGMDIIQIILFTWRDIMNHRTALRLKAACLGLLFKKMLTSNKIRVSSEENEKISKAMSDDCKKIYDLINSGVSIIDGPVVVFCVLICFPLWLSPVAISGFLMYFILHFIQYWLQNRAEYYKQTAFEYTSTRTQETLRILNYLRTIRILGWVQHFSQQIANCRRKESKCLWKFSFLKSLEHSISQTQSLMVVIAILLLQFTVCHSLTTTLAYPICAVIIVQMHNVLEATAVSISHLKNTREIFGNIKNRLHSIGDVNCYTTKPQEPSHAVTIIQGSFYYDSNENESQDSLNEDDKTNTTEQDGTGRDDLKSEIQALEHFLVRNERSTCLKDINFKAKKGQLIGICGDQGSGKSSLLLAALGQIRMASGQLMRQGSCAYTSQDPWLFDTTIKENLLFQEPFDAQRYYEAQIISQLREDIKKYPDADETMIVTADTSFSETLRQKIGLARAFYANRDIYFLDEPLKNIDVGVSREIFEDLIIKALTEKTILLVTNELEFLDRCDYIYVMHEGSVAEHGRQRELIRLDKRYAMMVRNSMDNQSTSEESHDGDQEVALVQRTEKRTSSHKKPSKGTLYPSSSSSLVDPKSGSSSLLSGMESARIEARSYGLFIKLANNKFFICPIIIVYVIYAGTQAFSLLRLSWWLESIETDHVSGSDTGGYFISYRDWFGSCLILIILGCLAQCYVVQSTLTRILNNLHDCLIKKFENLSIKTLHAYRFEKTKDAPLIHFNRGCLVVPNIMDDTLRCMIMYISSLFILMGTIPWFTNYFVVISIVCILLSAIYRNAMFHLKEIENTSEKVQQRYLQNSFIGLDTIRTFKKENDQLIKFQDLVDSNNMSCILQDIAGRWVQVRLKVLGSTCLFVAIILLLFVQKDISSSICGLTILYILHMPSLIWRTVTHFMRFETHFSDIQNILKGLELGKNYENEKKAPPTLNLDWPSTGKIEFDGVFLQGNGDQLGLQSSSFVINHAEKIAMLVPTDMDLELLTTTICGLHEVDQGKISIDQVDVSTVPWELLQNRISIVPSDPIFYGTLRSFLDPTKCHPDIEIWNSLDRINLKDTISRMDSQLNCMNFGEKLSYDEQRLLFVARAMIRRSKILLYEEKISTQTKMTSLVRRVITEEFKDCTVLVISRCIETVSLYNRVFIVNRGEIHEVNGHTSASNSDDLSRLLPKKERKRVKSHSHSSSRSSD